jgi:hypothetical protein
VSTSCGTARDLSAAPLAAPRRFGAGSSDGAFAARQGGKARVVERDPEPGRTFADGRVRVYGCSPGCLLVSLAVSVALTIALNVLIRLF